MSKQVKLKTGEVAEYPDFYDDDDIRQDLLRRDPSYAGNSMTPEQVQGFVKKQAPITQKKVDDAAGASTLYDTGASFVGGAQTVTGDVLKAAGRLATSSLADVANPRMGEDFRPPVENPYDKYRELKAKTEQINRYLPEERTPADIATLSSYEKAKKEVGQAYLDKILSPEDNPLYSAGEAVSQRGVENLATRSQSAQEGIQSFSDFGSPSKVLNVAAEAAGSSVPLIAGTALNPALGLSAIFGQQYESTYEKTGSVSKAMLAAGISTPLEFLGSAATAKAIIPALRKKYGVGLTEEAVEKLQSSSITRRFLGQAIGKLDPEMHPHYNAIATEIATEFGQSTVQTLVEEKRLPTALEYATVFAATGLSTGTLIAPTAISERRAVRSKAEVDQAVAGLSTEDKLKNRSTLAQYTMGEIDHTVLAERLTTKGISLEVRTSDTGVDPTIFNMRDNGEFDVPTLFNPDTPLTREKRIIELKEADPDLASILEADKGVESQLTKFAEGKTTLEGLYRTVHDVVQNGTYTENGFSTLERRAVQDAVYKGKFISGLENITKSEEMSLPADRMLPIANALKAGGHSEDSIRSSLEATQTILYKMAKASNMKSVGDFLNSDLGQLTFKNIQDKLSEYTTTEVDSDTVEVKTGWYKPDTGDGHQIALLKQNATPDTVVHELFHYLSHRVDPTSEVGKQMFSYVQEVAKKVHGVEVRKWSDILDTKSKNHTLLNEIIPQAVEVYLLAGSQSFDLKSKDSGKFTDSRGASIFSHISTALKELYKTASLGDLLVDTLGTGVKSPDKYFSRGQKLGMKNTMDYLFFGNPDSGKLRLFSAEEIGDFNPVFESQVLSPTLWEGPVQEVTPPGSGFDFISEGNPLSGTQGVNPTAIRAEEQSRVQTSFNPFGGYAYSNPYEQLGLLDPLNPENIDLVNAAMEQIVSTPFSPENIDTKVVPPSPPGSVAVTFPSSYEEMLYNLEAHLDTIRGAEGSTEGKTAQITRFLNTVARNLGLEEYKAKNVSRTRRLEERRAFIDKMVAISRAYQRATAKKAAQIRTIKGAGNLVVDTPPVAPKAGAKITSRKGEKGGGSVYYQTRKIASLLEGTKLVNKDGSPKEFNPTTPHIHSGIFLDQAQGPLYQEQDKSSSASVYLKVKKPYQSEVPVEGLDMTQLMAQGFDGATYIVQDKLGNNRTQVRVVSPEQVYHIVDKGAASNPYYQTRKVSKVEQHKEIQGEMKSIVRVALGMSPDTQITVGADGTPVRLIRSPSSPENLIASSLGALFGKNTPLSENIKGRLKYEVGQKMSVDDYLALIFDAAQLTDLTVERAGENVENPRYAEVYRQYESLDRAYNTEHQRVRGLVTLGIGDTSSDGRVYHNTLIDIAKEQGVENNLNDIKQDMVEMEEQLDLMPHTMPGVTAPYATNNFYSIEPSKDGGDFNAFLKGGGLEDLHKHGHNRREGSTNLGWIRFSVNKLMKRHVIDEGQSDVFATLHKLIDTIQKKKEAILRAKNLIAKQLYSADRLVSEEAGIKNYELEIKDMEDQLKNPVNLLQTSWLKMNMHKVVQDAAMSAGEDGVWSVGLVAPSVIHTRTQFSPNSDEGKAITTSYGSAYVDALRDVLSTYDPAMKKMEPIKEYAPGYYTENGISKPSEDTKSKQEYVSFTLTPQAIQAAARLGAIAKQTEGAVLHQTRRLTKKQVASIQKGLAADITQRELEGRRTKEKKLQEASFEGLSQQDTIDKLLLKARGAVLANHGMTPEEWVQFGNAYSMAQSYLDTIRATKSPAFVAKKEAEFEATIKKDYEALASYHGTSLRAIQTINLNKILIDIEQALKKTGIKADTQKFIRDLTVEDLTILDIVGSKDLESMLTFLDTEDGQIFFSKVRKRQGSVIEDIESFRQVVAGAISDMHHKGLFTKFDSLLTSAVYTSRLLSPTRVFDLVSNTANLLYNISVGRAEEVVGDLVRTGGGLLGKRKVSLRAGVVNPWAGIIGDRKRLTNEQHFKSLPPELEKAGALKVALSILGHKHGVNYIPDMYSKLAQDMMIGHTMTLAEQWAMYGTGYEKVIGVTLSEIQRIMAAMDVFTRINAEEVMAEVMAGQIDFWKRTGQYEDRIRDLATQHAARYKLFPEDKEGKYLTKIEDFVKDSQANPMILVRTAASEFGVSNVFMDKPDEIGKGINYMRGLLTFKGSVSSLRSLLWPFMHTTYNMARFGVSKLPAVTSLTSPIAGFDPIFGLASGIATLSRAHSKGQLLTSASRKDVLWGFVGQQIVGASIATMLQLMLTQGDLIPPPKDEEEEAYQKAHGIIPFSMRVYNPISQTTHFIPFPGQFKMFIVPLVTSIADLNLQEDLGPDSPDYQAAHAYMLRQRDYFVANSGTWTGALDLLLPIAKEKDIAPLVKSITSGLAPFSAMARSMNNAYQTWENGGVPIPDPSQLIGPSTTRTQEVGIAATGALQSTYGQVYTEHFMSFFGKYIPGMETRIPDRINYLGEPILRQDFFSLSLPWEWFPESPNLATDAVEQEWARLGKYPTPGDKTLTVAGKQLQMDADMYRDYVLTSGMMLKESYQRLLTSQGYSGASDEVREKMFERLQTEARSVGKQKVIGHYQLYKAENQTGLEKKKAGALPFFQPQP